MIVGNDNSITEIFNTMPVSVSALKIFIMLFCIYRHVRDDCNVNPLIIGRNKSMARKGILRFPQIASKVTVGLLRSAKKRYFLFVMFEEMESPDPWNFFAFSSQQS